MLCGRYFDASVQYFCDAYRCQGMRPRCCGHAYRHLLCPKSAARKQLPVNEIKDEFRHYKDTLGSIGLWFNRFNQLVSRISTLHVITASYEQLATNVLRCFQETSNTPFTRYNRLSNRFGKRIDNRLYRVNEA